MASHQRELSAEEYDEYGVEEPTPTGWVGWVIFAGVLMALAGCFNAVAGIVALVHDSYYLVAPSGLVIEVDYTAWGWILLGYGVVIGIAGICLFFGKTWARVVGVIVAGLNALLHLGFLAAYPIWSVLIIALDVIVIYALIMHGREVRAMS